MKKRHIPAAIWLFLLLFDMGGMWIIPASINVTAFIFMAFRLVVDHIIYIIVLLFLMFYHAEKDAEKDEKQ